MPQHPCRSRTRACCGFPAVAPRCLLCLCSRPKGSTVFCTPSRCAHRGRCPPGSAAHVKISSLAVSAFKLASLAEKTSVNPQRELFQAPQSQGKASCWCCNILHKCKTAMFLEGTFSKGVWDFHLVLAYMHNWYLAGAKCCPGQWPFPGMPPPCFPLLMRNSPMPVPAHMPAFPCSVGTWGSRPHPKWRLGFGQPGSASAPQPQHRDFLRPEWAVTDGVSLLVRLNSSGTNMPLMFKGQVEHH